MLDLQRYLREMMVNVYANKHFASLAVLLRMDLCSTFRNLKDIFTPYPKPYVITKRTV